MRHIANRFFKKFFYKSLIIWDIKLTTLKHLLLMFKMWFSKFKRWFFYSFQHDHAIDEYIICVLYPSIHSILCMHTYKLYNTLVLLMFYKSFLQKFFRSKQNKKKKINKKTLIATFLSLFFWMISYWGFFFFLNSFRCCYSYLLHALNHSGTNILYSGVVWYNILRTTCLNVLRVFFVLFCFVWFSFSFYLMVGFSWKNEIKKNHFLVKH